VVRVTPRGRGARWGAVALVVLAGTGCGKDKSCLECPKPPPPYPVIDSPAALIQVFAETYRRRDYDKFTTLLANDATAHYFFFLSPDTPPDQVHCWDYMEEVRIHRRMLRPDSLLRCETKLIPRLRLTDVKITLSALTPFAERHDLYRSVGNPGGLDSLRWRVKESMYHTDVLFQLAGDYDYQVNGKSNFVVIEDLTKTAANAPGKWLLYRWEDLCGYPAEPGYRSSLEDPGLASSQGSGGVALEPVAGIIGIGAVAPKCWSSVKELYRR